MNRAKFRRIAKRAAIHENADRKRRDAELRDWLDALDDAQTETALDTLLRNAPDLQRKALRELSLIDHDATVDALNETGSPE